MSIYVMLASFTEEGRRTAAANPERMATMAGEIEQTGASILSSYGRISSFDIVDVIETPDAATIERIRELMQAPDILPTTRFMGPYPSARHKRLDVQQIGSR